MVCEGDTMMSVSPWEEIVAINSKKNKSSGTGMLLYQQEFVSNRRLRTTNSVGPCDWVLLGLIKELGSTLNRWAGLPLRHAAISHVFLYYYNKKPIFHSSRILECEWYLSWSLEDGSVRAKNHSGTSEREQTRGSRIKRELPICSPWNILL